MTKRHPLFKALLVSAGFLPTVACFISCQKDKSEGTFVENPSTPVTVSDTTAQESTAQAPKAEPWPPLSSSASTTEILQYLDTCRMSDLYTDGIMARMAEEAPEYARKIINSGQPRFLIVDKRAMELALFDKYGHEELRYGIACARNYGTKHKKGDSRTPEGYFTVKGVYDSTDWLFTDDNGRTSKKKGQYGPRFIRITPVIGIHGTCSPWTIGHRSSQGCIRVTNENILNLVQFVDSGMPVIVSPGDRDKAVNSKEGHLIAQFTIDPIPDEDVKAATTPADKKSVESAPDTLPAIEETPSVPAEMPDTTESGY